MSMASTAECSGNRTHIRPIWSRTHAEVATAIPIVPDYAKRMLWRKPLADLARKDRTLDGRNDFFLE